MVARLQLGNGIEEEGSARTEYASDWVADSTAHFPNREYALVYAPCGTHLTKLASVETFQIMFGGLNKCIQFFQFTCGMEEGDREQLFASCQPDWEFTPHCWERHKITGNIKLQRKKSGNAQEYYSHWE